MRKYEVMIILGILILIEFLTAHFMIAIYYRDVYINYEEEQIWQWIVSDIFLYTAIIFQIILILMIVRSHDRETA